MGFFGSERGNEKDRETLPNIQIEGFRTVSERLLTGYLGGNVDLKQIKELMTAMERAGIKKLTVKQKGGDELHLERQDEHPSPSQPVATFYPPVYAHPPVKEPEGAHRAAPVHKAPHEEASHSKEKPQEKSGKFVAAPLVGTFYSAASPDDPHFVKVGDRVDENTVVCIIEAMKVMNEVKAGMSGTIAEILVDNAHPVEFGTKLFRIV
jgi:acetyl-CoA carboxylase biotin carboxyl carrier protein